MRAAPGHADRVPRWVLAVGPLLVLVIVAATLYVTNPFAALAASAGGGPLQLLCLLTIVGAVAGIVPVAIGMLWFPYVASLDERSVHGAVALGAGVLAFIGVRMVDGLAEHGGAVANTSTAVAVALLGVIGTFAALYVLGEWRRRTTRRDGRRGLQIAYFVAIALGLHSVGEGMAIGVSTVEGEVTLVLLLVVGFVVHNVLEGLTVVSVMARDGSAPGLRHFGVVGVVAGGPVILGGWLGSLGTSSLVVMLWYAIAIGAILQAMLELVQLVRIDAGGVLTRITTTTFVGGFVVMFLLEDVVVEGLVVPG